jgi:hypothetical protein
MTIEQFEAAQDAREAKLDIHLTAYEKAVEDLALTMDKVYSNFTK